MKNLLLAATALSLTAGAALAGPNGKDKAPAKAEVKCAVMGQKVADVSKATKSEYKGKTYYFCCAGCKPEFDKNPAKYAKADPKPAKPPKTKPNKS